MRKIKLPIILFGIFAFFALFYSLQLNYEFGYDMYYYSTMIEQALGLDSFVYLKGIELEQTGLFFHGHPLYNVFVLLFYKVVELFTLQKSMILVLPLVSAIFGAINASLIFLLFYLLFRRFSWALLFMALTVFSFVFWFFAVTPEMPMFSSFFILFLFVYVLHRTQRQFKHFPNIPLGILVGLSIFWHVENVLLFPCFLLVLIYINRKETIVALSKSIVLYTIIVLIVAGGSFATVAFGFKGISTVRDFYSWITAYGINWLNFDILSNLKLSAICFLKCFLGGVGKGGAGGWANKIFIFIFLFHIIGTMGYATFHFKKISEVNRQILIVAFCYFVSLAITATIWDPDYLERWAHIIFPFWLMSGISVRDIYQHSPEYKKRLYLYLTALLIILVCLNFLTLRSSTITKADFYKIETQYKKLEKETNEDTVFLICSKWEAIEMNYLSRRQAVSISDLIPSSKVYSKFLDNKFAQFDIVYADEHLFSPTPHHIINWKWDYFISSDDVQEFLKGWKLEESRFFLKKDHRYFMLIRKRD